MAMAKSWTAIRSSIGADTEIKHILVHISSKWIDKQHEQQEEMNTDIVAVSSNNCLNIRKVI